MSNPRALLVIGAIGVAVLLFLTLSRDRVSDRAGEVLGPKPRLALEGSSASVEDLPTVDRAPTPGPTRTALANGATSSTETSATNSTTGVSVTGSVIDTRSLPIASAEVRLWVSGRPMIATHTDDDGQFALEGVPPADRSGLVGTVHAVAPDGRVAAHVTHVPKSRSKYESRALELVVGSARTRPVNVPVTVIVEREGLPVADAEVELEAGFERVLVGLARSDADGRAHDHSSCERSPG